MRSAEDSGGQWESVIFSEEEKPVQQQGEAQGTCGFPRLKWTHWRSPQRDETLTKASPGYGSLSGVSLLLVKWPFG